MSTAIALVPEDVSVSSDALIADAWRRHEQLRGTRRQTSAEWAAVRRELGALLAAKQAELARIGRASEFAGYLRSQGIRKATAYRYIALHNGVKKNSLTETVSAAPVLRLRGQDLNIRLTPCQAFAFRDGWERLTRPGSAGFDFRREFLNFIAGRVPYHERSPHGDFVQSKWGATPEQCAALPPLVVRKGEPGTVRG